MGKIQKIQGALLHARCYIRGNSKRGYWECKHAEDYIIFSWFHHYSTGIEGTRLARRISVPCITNASHALVALKDKRPFSANFNSTHEWLEDRLLEDPRYFSYFLDKSIIETISDGRVLFFNFDGMIINKPEQEFEDYELKIILSKRIYERYFKKLVE
jgi:hypothetical protein